jgi:transcriptional regulator with XRE-family HTH domain
MRLAKALKLMRVTEGIGTREQAARIGISFPTLNRIERGAPCSLPVLVKILMWLVAPDGGE